MKKTIYLFHRNSVLRTPICSGSAKNELSGCHTRCGKIKLVVNKAIGMQVSIFARFGHWRCRLYRNPET